MTRSIYTLAAAALAVLTFCGPVSAQTADDDPRAENRMERRKGEQIGRARTVSAVVRSAMPTQTISASAGAAPERT